MADFIDWLYSPEGMQINGNANGTAGPLGLTWKIDTNGQPVLTEFGKKALLEDRWKCQKNMAAETGMLEGQH